MRKNSVIGVGVIIVLVVIAGSYAAFHKSPQTPVSSASTSTTQKSTTSATSSGAVLQTKTSTTLGNYLANSSGMALYTYSKDTSGVSNCTGSCLSDWPAYQDMGATTGLPTGVSTIKRTDNGETQYTYNGLPLYTFVGDSSGQATGNGISGFSLAKPVTATSSTSSSSSANPY